MSVIARFTVPAEQFPLGDVLEVEKGIQIRLESMIPTGDSLIPYFWVETAYAADVEKALQESALIETVHVVDRTDVETLFRVTWSPEVNGLIDAIERSEAVLMEADGLGDTWSFRMRFPEHDQLSEFYRTCADQGLTLELDEINNPLGNETSGEFGLTDAQRDALLAALESGYFDVPRGITLEELARQFDVSDTALSQRLRRGLNTVLSSSLPRPSMAERVEQADDESE